MAECILVGNGGGGSDIVLVPIGDIAVNDVYVDGEDVE